MTGHFDASLVFLVVFLVLLFVLLFGMAWLEESLRRTHRRRRVPGHDTVATGPAEAD